MLINNDFDLFSITETWLRPGDSDSVVIGNLIPNGYSFLSTLVEVKGGGVGLQFKKSLDVKKIQFNKVKRNFYVDDCLKSVPNGNKAIHLADNLRKLLAKGGFNLTKWVSNSRKLIDTLPESARAGSFKDLHLDQLPVERALGVRWDVEDDKFCFKIDVNDKPLPSLQEAYFPLSAQCIRPSWFRSSSHPASQRNITRSMPEKDEVG